MHNRVASTVYVLRVSFSKLYKAFQSYFDLGTSNSGSYRPNIIAALYENQIELFLLPQEND
jgi:hypothetical protein